ncbi:MAG TPA: ATP-binding protein, partial [Arthrobacter sp.]|nr:ATP-binding protein [Arthrobacter sp.]
QMRQALEAIKAGSKDALAEVRDVLAVLRQDAPRAPAQRLDQLPELLARAEQGGLTVRLDNRAGQLPESAVPAESVAYRVVQEAVTNIVRHAHASHAWVGISVSDAVLEVTVEDDGVGLGDAPEGNGLRGMRERIDALDGDLAVGTREPAGTRVHARIPLPGNRPAADGGPASGRAGR